MKEVGNTTLVVFCIMMKLVALKLIFMIHEYMCTHITLYAHICYI